MDTLNPRKSFIDEETAALFSNEKVATTRNKIIECLNQIGLSNNQTEKCENIVKIQELILHQELDLLDEFIEDILALGHDSNAEVRKSVVVFVEKLCQVDISYLPRIINLILTLLRDAAPQVVKRVIQGCSSVYKNALKFLSDSATNITDELEQAWNNLCLVKTQILDMLDHENDGIRTNAIKFLEGVIIYQTNSNEEGVKKGSDFSLQDIPATLKILKRRKLEDEAMNIFDLLLKFHGASHISSVNLIACTGTLCNIAKVRPSLMLNVIDALKSLHNNLPPTLTNSQVVSVRKQLKMQFLSLLKQPAAIERQTQMIQVLLELGCQENEIKRLIPKIDKLSQFKKSKRPAEGSELPNTKKIRLITKKAEQSELMEIDEEALEEQRVNSNAENEKFVFGNLKTIEQVIDLVMVASKHLPDQPPEYFLKNYAPIINLTIPEQLKKIAEGLAVQMTEQKLGPGSKCFTKDPPVKVKPIDVSVVSNSTKEMDDKDEENTTRRLKETLERMRGQQDKQLKTKTKQKVTKTLQETTKPLSKETKNSLLKHTVERILNCNRKALYGKIVCKRNKILTVFGSTFLPDVRNQIFDYILEDFVGRESLAFSWLFEEYSLLQGFIRHSYVKTEQKPDKAYNDLLVGIISSISAKTELKEKRVELLKKLYMEAPIITNDACNLLDKMCELEEFSQCAMDIASDMILRKPVKSRPFLEILLKYSVSPFHNICRERALDKISDIYDALPEHYRERIQDFALKQMVQLTSEVPPEQFNNSVWTEDLAKICLMLIMQLLPFEQELINDVADTYIHASSDMKRTILRQIEAPVKKMGSSSSVLMKLIEKCATGVETLIIRIIYILTEKATPTPELMERIRKLSGTKISDVRLLIPVVNALTKKEILNILPQLLKLNPIVVKEVFNRILSTPSESNISPPITPTELLVALHTVDLGSVELKFTVKAISICLSENEVYTHDVLAVVLQQLSEMTPLPTLFMRTVIQSLTLYPRLSGFVINMLQRLILKQVWKQQKVVWDGFIKCCQRLLPASLGVLIQLPAPQLEDALKICPELKDPLLEYAQSITENQIGNVCESVMQILTGKNEGISFNEPSSKMPAPVPIKSESVEGESKDNLRSEPAPPGMD